MANLVNTGLQYFFPEVSSTLAVTNASANVNIGSVGEHIVLYNDGFQTAYFQIGLASVVAVAGGVATVAAGTVSAAIPQGQRINIRVPEGLFFLAGITDTGTTTLRISRGSGV